MINLSEVGSFKILKTASLIIPEGESGKIDAEFDRWPLSISVEFDSNPKNENFSKSTIDIRGDGENHAVLIFREWINPLGTAMKAPGYLGKSRNKGLGLYFMAAHWLIGTTNRIDIQLMLGEPQ